MPSTLARAHRAATIIALLVASMATSTRAASILYNVTNLGVRDPIALNDAGQVALNQDTDYEYYNPIYGERNSTASSFTHALLYNGYGPNAGGMIYVGPVLPTATSDPNKLNSVTTYSGQVLAKPETTDTATGLTPSGQVAVTSAAGSFLTDGKTYQVAPTSPAAGVTLPNGTPVYVNSLMAINASGQIAGNYYPQSPTDPNSHVVLLSKGAVTDLGNLGGTASTAYAVNSSGQVVGTSQTPVTSPYNNHLDSHAFLATGAVMKDLGTLGGSNSIAYAINNQGTVVGTADVDPNLGSWSANPLHSQHAFVSDGSKLVDLNSLISDQLNLTLNSAVAINSVGQILAAGQAGTNYVENAYLLTPIDQPTPITPTLAPEPSSIVILGIVAGATWWRRRTHKSRSDASGGTIS